MATLTVGSGKDYSTIETALAAANASDIISIDAGTYEEYHLAYYDVGLTIKAADEVTGSVIMDGLGSTSREYAFYSYASGAIFQHITFKNFEEYAVRRGTTAGGSMTLENCLAYGCDGPVISAIGHDATTPVEIKDCIFITDEDSPIVVGGNSTIHIQNSILATNKNDEAVLMSSISYPNVTASHCTFIGRGWNGSDGRHYHLINQVAKVNNCILYGGNGHGIQADSHDHNLVYLTHVDSEEYVEFEAASWDSDSVSAGTGDLTGDPLFVTSPTQGSVTPNLNLYLQADSPAINVGSSAITTDLSGNLRDATPDIGPFEYIITRFYTSYGDPHGIRHSETGLTHTVMADIASDYRRRDPDGQTVPQPPFSLATRGVIFRNRPVPYIVSLSGIDPDDIISDD